MQVSPQPQGSNHKLGPSLHAAVQTSSIRANCSCPVLGLALGQQVRDLQLVDLRGRRGAQGEEGAGG
jgi:hypothetical protein